MVTINKKQFSEIYDENMNTLTSQEDIIKQTELYLKTNFHKQYISEDSILNNISKADEENDIISNKNTT